MRIKRRNSLEALMKTKSVKGQNEHNRENHDVSKDILCEIYCLGLHKRLNNSRHHVHWLASKSDRLSLGNSSRPKATYLDARYFRFILFQQILHIVAFPLSSNSFNVGDC